VGGTAVLNSASTHQILVPIRCWNTRNLHPSLLKMLPNPAKSYFHHEFVTTSCLFYQKSLICHVSLHLTFHFFTKQLQHTMCHNMSVTPLFLKYISATMVDIILKQFLSSNETKPPDCLNTVFLNNVFGPRSNLVSYTIKTQNKTGNVHINITLRYIHVTTTYVEKQ